MRFTIKTTMAESEELKQMVLSFRRAELVELLGFVGMNKVGVKATLLQRAVALINSSRGCSVPVQIKIRDLYRQIHNPYAAEPPCVRNVTRSQQQPIRDPINLYPTDDRSRRYLTNKVAPVQLVSALPVGLVTGAIDFSKRTQDSLSAANSSIPVHPDVKFKPLPFYDLIGELLKPTTLAPKGPSRYQETYFVFHLTPQQAQNIAMSRDFRPMAKCEYIVQVQLRFCLMETSCEQDDNFPPSICVRVNGKLAQLPTPIPTAKPGVEPKRPGRPVDITSLCRISPTMPNHIEISWASEYGWGYVVSINLVKRLSSDILLQQLKQFGYRLPDHSRAMIKEKMHHDADSEIATTSLRVSLLCPLGKMKMQLPSRAGTCTHIQCFDATTFLMMNEKKATWLCPVCDKPSPFHKLIIDGLFVEILRSVSDVDEIQFVEDGSWSPVKPNSKDAHTIKSTPVALKHSHAVLEKTVNLCGDASSNDSSTCVPPKKAKLEVIDLTETDSEDETDVCRSHSSHEISSGCASPPFINIDSPAGPLSISSISSFDSQKYSSTHSSVSSFSPHFILSSSPPSSSSSSNSTIGYNIPGPSGTCNSPLQSPNTSPRSHWSSCSPYKSPLQSPVSPGPSSHPLSPLAMHSSAYYTPFSTIPPAMALPYSSLFMSSPNPGMSEDHDIEEFILGLYNEYR